MSTEDVRVKLYRLNNENRTIRSNMMKSLQLSSKGEFEAANRMLDESKRELDKVKSEHRAVLEQASKKHAADTNQALGYTEVLHDTIAQIHRLQSRNCSAVKVHIYN